MLQISPNVWSWSWFSSEKNYMFNGTLVCGSGKKVLIDPVKMAEEDKKKIAAMGPYEAIYLTNKDHERAAYELRREWNLPVWIHDKDKEFLKEPPDKTFHEGSSLAGGITVFHLPDQKSPGESAFYLLEEGILILGDALIGVPAGNLNLLPPEKYKNFGKAKAGIERLRPLYFEKILVGDGTPVLENAHQILEDFFFRCAIRLGKDA